MRWVKGERRVSFLLPCLLFCVSVCVCVGVRQCLLAISILIFFSCSSVFVCNLNLLYNFIVKCLLTAFCPTCVFPLAFSLSLSLALASALSSSAAFFCPSLIHPISFARPLSFLFTLPLNSAVYTLLLYRHARTPYQRPERSSARFGAANKKPARTENAMPI